MVSKPSFFSLVGAFVLLSLAGTPAESQGTRFLRQPSLSAEHVAFTHGADLWVVDRDGGLARRLTSTPAVESDPHISPDGRLVAVSTRGQSVTLIDVNQRRITGQFRGQGLGGALAFSPDSKTLASASGDGTVRLWNFATGQTALMLQHLGPANGVSFSNDGTMMATSGADATVRLWPAANLSEANVALP